MATVETTADAPEMDAEGSPTPTETNPAAKPAMGGKAAATTQARARADEAIPDDPDAVRAELERTREALKKANREAADRRRRLDELEAKEREAEDAKLSETERIKKAVAESTARVRDLERANAEKDARIASLVIDHAVQAEAAEAGFLYPHDVPKLIDRDRVAIDEETGKVAGAKDAVARLAKERPGLLRGAHGAGSPQAMATRRPGQGGGQPAGPPVDVESDLRRHIAYPV